MKFKIGDRVIKARPYSTGKYCCYGGNRVEVPLNTEGRIIKNNSYNRKPTDYRVAFDNGISWDVNESEIELAKILSWRNKLK